MTHKNTSAFYKILYKSALVVLFIGVSFTSWSQTTIITTVAGNGYGAGNFTGGYSGDGGSATAAELYTPYGVAVDASGNIYIADWENYRIRKVAASGSISTIAGNGFEGYSGDGGQATAAEVNANYVTVDASGNIYISGNSMVRKINTSGIISTIAGNGVQGYSGDGGPATAAEFWDLNAGAIDAAGNVYIADDVNQRIRKVNSSGIVTTIVGNGYGQGSNDGGYSGDGGPATAAELHEPNDVKIDASGNLYIADSWSNVIRKVNTSGIISTVAGNEPVGTGNGIVGGGFSGDGGPATAAELDGDYAVAVDASGNIYIADVVNYRIRMVNTSGIINTIAGNGIQGYSGDGVPATAAEINQVYALAVSLSGGIYVADEENNVIREVAPPSVSVSGSVMANVSCRGGNNGSASAITYRGTTPYTYSWSPEGQTTSSITGLSAGTYTITVTDGGDSTVSAIVVINQPNVLSTTASVTADVSCYGGNNGSVSAIPSGGTTPYTYSWTPGGETTITASDLNTGTYTVTVQDSCGESATASAVITQPNALSTIASATTNVNCYGGNNGSASANPSDGTTPYTYSWSNGTSTSSTGDVLSAGTYTITVQDSCGESATAFITITQPQGMTISHDSVATTLGCNGIASVTPNGGASPYTYSWTFGQTTDTIKNLCANSYCCTVTDNNGCSQTTCITVTSATGIQNLSNSSSISIYPNPNNGYFTIAGITQGQIIELYNYLGQKVVRQLADNSTIHFDISTKANGIYLVRIMTKDGILITQKKILKTQ